MAGAVFHATYTALTCWPHTGMCHCAWIEWVQAHHAHCCERVDSTVNLQCRTDSELAPADPEQEGSENYQASGVPTRLLGLALTVESMQARS
jgi:hypothetical protein